MNAISIKSIKTGEIIYKGRHRDVSEGVEYAVRHGICLDHADLRRANLVNANLDEVCLRHACLTGANLTGANLSEACLDHCHLQNTTLYGTCLAFSSLRHANFDGALFGGTDIAGANLDGARFSTLSAFLLNFTDAATLENCRFLNSDGAESFTPAACHPWPRASLCPSG